MAHRAWRRTSRATRTGVVAVACVLVAAGLSACSTDRASPAGPDTGPSHAGASEPATPPGLDRFYRQRIAWSSCAGVVAGDLPAGRSECGRLTVPIDYARPDGPTASVALFRLRSAQRPTGVLITNPGGPGVSGVDYAAGTAEKFAGREITRTLDVVGFDPRGVGRSTPAIRCRTDARRDAVRARDWVDTSPAGIAAIERRNADLAGDCRRQVGDRTLAHMGTREVVADIDVLRGAMGYQQLNYLGYSYGTLIGALYAERFGDRVRTMVNDGAVDPSVDPMSDVVAQNTGFQRAFDRFATDCVARRDCALGYDAASATARYHQLVRALIGRRAPTADPRGLSYADAVTGTGQALYAPDFWRVLRAGLAQLRAGRGDILLRLADLYEGRDRAGRYDTTSDAFSAIRCVDGPAISDRSVIDRLDTTLRRAAPFRDDGRGSGRGAAEECAFWPVPPTSGPHRVAPRGLPQTVVVSTTDDPATPYAAGVSLARQLGARLLTFRGTQHTASFEGDRCVDDALTRYVVDRTPIPTGLTC